MYTQPVHKAPGPSSPPRGVVQHRPVEWSCWHELLSGVSHLLTEEWAGQILTKVQYHRDASILLEMFAIFLQNRSRSNQGVE